MICRGGDRVKTKYPIILAHGIILKDFKYFKAFGKIEKILKSEGCSVYTSKTDGFGTVENNAVQLKAQIIKILQAENAEKVNSIAHSKGGLDARYMIESLGMEDKVASLTTLCTPHKGSQIATKILSMPKPLKKFTSFWVNFVYRIFGDKKPDSLTVCEQLKSLPDAGTEVIDFSDKVYCQSYSAQMKRSRDDFVMGIPLMFSKKYERGATDGVVSEESSKFGSYRGECAEGSVSHSEIVDFMVRKKKKEKIYAFYIGLCRELAEKGF